MKRKQDFLLFFLGVVYFLIPTLLFDETDGDYKIFIQQPIDLLYGFNKWFDWSSRLFIESSVNIFSKNIPIYILITLIAGGVLFWSVARILSIKKSWQAGLLFSLALLINIYMYSTAGIFATLVNYLWPAACFIFVLAMILKPFKNKNARVIANILIWPMMVFAVCSEQLAVLGLMIFGLILLKSIFINKKASKKVIILLLISILGIVNVLISPGNDRRTDREISIRWSDFHSMSIRSKVEIGVSATFARLFTAPELPILAMMIGIAILAYKRGELDALFIILPSLIICGMFLFPESLPHSTVVRSANYFNQLRENSALMESGTRPTKDEINIYITMFIIFTSSIILSIFKLYGKTKKSFYIIFSLVCGLTVSLAASLSPTLFASNTRTIIFLIFIVVAINYIIYNDLINERRRI